MALFGSFETEREISSTPEAVVFTARKVGEPGILRFALKLFPPPPTEEGLSLLETARPAGPGWEATAAQRIELQKRAAAASPLIVPIVESGRDERGIWCLTRLYPHSVQMLLAGRVALNREAIHRILLAVTRAALACKQHCGRGHGAIKPSNILLGGTELKQAEIGLSDPAAGGDSDTGRIERADLRGLGLVLFQLVRRRELADTADWLVQRIEMTAEWSGAFGRSAGDWLALCNRLLDPALSENTFDLEKLEAALVALEPKPAVSRRAWAAAAAVATLAAAGVALLVWLRTRGTLEIMSNVPDAQVTVRKVRGETVSKPAQQKVPLKLRLRADDYEIVGSFGDLTPVTNTVTLAGGKRTNSLVAFVYGSLTVQSTTVGAMLTFTNGTNAPLPYVNPYARTGEISQMKLQVRKDGFIPVELTGVVEPGKPLVIEASLKPRPAGTAQVKLESTPVDARFYLDGQLTNSGGTIYLFPGTYRVSAKYRDWKQEPTNNLTVAPVTAGKENDIQSVRLRFQSTVVTFDCEPPNATLYVNESPYTNGVVPSFDLFESGRTRFRFEAPGHNTNTVDWVLVDGQRTNVTVRLKPLGGVIKLTSDPPEASLWTNGVPVAGPNAQTPATLLLPEGTYEIKATYGGLAEKRLGRLLVTNGMVSEAKFVFDFGIVRLVGDPAEGTAFSWISNGVSTAIPRLPYFAPGEHTFVASNPSYKLANVVTNAFVTASMTNLLVLRFNYGSVIITSVPPTGPLVWAGTNLLGKIPWTNRVVPFGTQHYTLKLSGKPDGLLRVPITNTGLFTFSHNFERLPPVTNMLGMRFEFIPENRIFVSRYETTREEFKRVLTNAFATPSPTTNLPARQVKWKEAQDFCRALETNAMFGDFKPTELGQPVNRGDYRYSIPTEEEWNTYKGDIPARAVLSGSGPKPIGSGSDPNRFGLFDLYGNVAEYCTGADQKIWLIGGSFLSASFFRASPHQRIAEEKDTGDAGNAGSDVGFRVILRPKP